MTQEDKAKRYDEALEIAKKNYVASQDLREDSKIDVECFKNTLESIFPELKGSEDERIRKELTEFLKSAAGGFLDTAIQCKTFGKWVAWLEKQDIFSKKDVDDAYLKGVTDTKNEIEKQYEANSQIRKDIATFILNYKGYIKDRGKWIDYLGIKVSFVKNQDKQKPQGKSALEAIKEEKVDNQNCVKPTDKVEPRFYEGNWVVNRFGDVWYIDNFDKKNYQVSDGKGNYNYFPISKQDEMHHWTIQDAKDGDVVCYKGEISLYKHDIKNCTKREPTFGGFVYHCCYDGKRFITDCLYSLTEQDKMNIHPATKEQRDLLFTKMKEVGYKWDYR